MLLFCTIYMLQMFVKSLWIVKGFFVWTLSVVHSFYWFFLTGQKVSNIHWCTSFGISSPACEFLPLSIVFLTQLVTGVCWRCHPYTASRTRPTAGCARRPHGRNGPSLPTAGNGLLRWHPCLENSRLRASEERCSEWTDTVLVQPAILLQPFWLQDVCQGLPEWRWHGQDDAHVSLLCRDARLVDSWRWFAVRASE